MNEKDIFSLHQAVPNAKKVVVHMEGVNHNTLSRRELIEFINEKTISDKVIIPLDGEKINM